MGGFFLRNGLNGAKRMNSSIEIQGGWLERLERVFIHSQSLNS